MKAIKTILAAAFCVFGTWFFVYGNPQMRNIRAAQGHVPIVRRALDRSSEYRHLRAGVTTSDNGAMVIQGNLKAKDQLADLMALVMSTNPPVKVKYSIRVGRPSTEIGDRRE